MRRRRTVRDYLTEPVSEESLSRILKAATLPPSGADTLPYAFIIVKNAETKQRIREYAEKIEGQHPHSDCEDLQELFKERQITKEKPFLIQAPLLIVVVGDTSKPYWLESTWVAISYLIIAIEGENLSSITYTPSETGFLNEMLDIPPEFSAQVIIPIGRAAEKLPPKDSRPEGKVFYEKYG